MTPTEAFQRRWFAVDRARASFCKANKITSSMLTMLLAVDHEHVGLTKGTSGMARLLDVAVSAAGETVRQIEAADLVERTSLYELKAKKEGAFGEMWTDPNVKSIVLTPKGRQLLASYLAAMNRAYQSVEDPPPVQAPATLVVQASKKVSRVQKATDRGK